LLLPSPSPSSSFSILVLVLVFVFQPWARAKPAKTAKLNNRHERIGKSGGRQRNLQSGDETSITKAASRYGKSQIKPSDNCQTAKLRRNASKILSLI
jgi:hypothetical protein